MGRKSELILLVFMTVVLFYNQVLNCQFPLPSCITDIPTALVRREMPPEYPHPHKHNVHTNIHTSHQLFGEIGHAYLMVSVSLDTITINPLYFLLLVCQYTLRFSHFLVCAKNLSICFISNSLWDFE